MKDYAKLVNTPREQNHTQKAQPQEQPNLVRSAKELQSKEGQGNKNIFGILLVVFIVLAVGYGVVRQYLATHHIDLSTGRITKEISQIKKTATGQQSSVPQFDFYTVLPNGNTPTANNNTNQSTSTNTSTPDNNTSNSAAPAPTTAPAQQPSTATPPPAPPAAPVTTINVSSAKYYLNIGDYSTNDDAQKMLSQLLLLGVQAAVMPKNDNGASVYEVLVGPFNNQDAMNVVKSQLDSHQINSSVIQS